jgi:hypothetical protein
MKDEILASITGIDGNLVKEFLDDYELLHQSYFKKDYEKTLLKSGKLIETTFQIFEFLLNGKYTLKPSINSVLAELENKPVGSVPESIRTILPRLGKAVYTIRSKNGGGHKSIITPQEVDAFLCVQVSKYILAELLRLYSNLPDKKKMIYVRYYLRPKIPFIQEFENGDLCILVKTDSCKDKILLVLYGKYPMRIDKDKIKAYVKNESSNNILTSLKNAEKESYIHISENGCIITDLGKDYIERKFEDFSLEKFEN